MKKKISLFILLLLVSCDDNNSFYIKDQSIVSCKDKGIYNISITGFDNDVSFDINWVDSLRKAPPMINLDKIDKGYKITRYIKWKSKTITNEDFKLFSSKKIKIKRHQGDVVSQEIEIATDEKGKIIKSSQKNCECEK